MGYTIKIRMDDWLKNAGIVGLYNILQAAGDEVVIEGQQLSFDSCALEGFADKYFAYLINKYRSMLSINKILAFEPQIRRYQTTAYADFDIKALEEFNSYVTDVLKHYLKSKSYKRAYELIESTINPLALEKQIKPVKLKKGQAVEEVLPQVQEVVGQVEKVFAYLKLPVAKRYIGAYNVIYTFINNAWTGVSFLNPQTKEKDVYIDYQTYFVEPVRTYLVTDKTKYAYRCFGCDEPMKDLKNDLAFMTKTGFDVARKSSNVWNFQNDVAVCPLCKLIYTCLPAAMVYTYQKGLYINNTSSLRAAIDTNQNYYSNLYRENGSTSTRGSLYRALMEAVVLKQMDLPRYELADIQVVRYQEGSYRFNLLSKQLLLVLAKSSKKKNFQLIAKMGYREIKTYFYLYDQVMERLMNGQNQFSLIHKLVYCKLSTPTDCHFSMAGVISILLINSDYLEEVGVMNGKQLTVEVIKGSKAGQELRRSYSQKQAVDKLNGIVYRLLNALKTGNSGVFMDSLLKAYLYVKEPVPMVMADVLRDEDDFRTIGYAFVAGLLNTAEADDKLKKEKN